MGWAYVTLPCTNCTVGVGGATHCAGCRGKPGDNQTGAWLGLALSCGANLFQLIIS